jgi:D-amino peptidase
MGVPVALVTGDEAACAEAREVLGDVETVAVKTGIDRYSAELLPPARAQGLIREASRRALRSLHLFSPCEVPAPYTLGIDWASTSMAESCAMIPGVKRTGARSVEFTSDDYAEIMSVLGILAIIGGSVGCTGAQYG